VSSGSKLEKIGGSLIWCIPPFWFFITIAWFQFFRTPTSQLDIGLRLAWLTSPLILAVILFARFKAWRKTIIFSCLTYFLLFCCLGMTKGAINAALSEFLHY
jgi:hypothetical protein